ncbi:OmpH family outer membrane protein [Mariniblastus fucicola]|uniref:OmpH family outer membrane protein n=1 Tax=Mariniblastus fucicola TaxID=980251 RepID=UPI0009461BC1|nr:OmpH family outer membrane protein [Mariniblastus fucicola]
MKSLISSIALAVLAVSSFASAAVAQDGGIVAVLDVAKVFKVNQSFDSEMKKIKQDAEDLKAQIQQEQEAIKAEAMQISQYEAGSPDRNKMEAAVEQKQASLRTRARQAEADLLNQEAGIYYNTYMKMQQVVGDLAAKHGISMVVRFDGGSVDPDKRPEVIKAVNRTVVFHRDIDLTNMVINGMGPRIAETATNVK